MLMLWPQGALLFQQPVGKNKEGDRGAPGAKHSGRHLALHREKPKPQVSRFITISSTAKISLQPWYKYVLHESKAVLAQNQPRH